jgi:FkbM family methyltransferase
MKSATGQATLTPNAPLHVRRSWKALFDAPDEAAALAALFARSQAIREGRTPTTSSPGDRVALHPRALGGLGVVCRDMTTDAEVFDDTFVGLYHMPPVALKAGAVILDLGANVGYTAAHYLVTVAHSRVIAVEMDEDNLRVCRENLTPFGSRATLLHAAAWTSDGFIEYGGSEAWGLRIGDEKSAGSRRATAKRVETILNEAGVDRVDFAKVDIEGAEAEVLRADAAWLRQVNVIMVEHHPPATRESMLAALEGAGFRVSIDTRHSRCLTGVREG